MLLECCKRLGDHTHFVIQIVPTVCVAVSDLNSLNPSQNTLHPTPTAPYFEQMIVGVHPLYAIDEFVNQSKFIPIEIN